MNEFAVVDTRSKEPLHRLVGQANTVNEARVALLREVLDEGTDFYNAYTDEALARAARAFFEALGCHVAEVKA